MGVPYAGGCIQTEIHTWAKTPRHRRLNFFSEAIGKSSAGMAQISRSSLPALRNEALLNFAPGSAERTALRLAVDTMKTQTARVPVVINGKEIHTSKVGKQLNPSNHSHVVCTFSNCDTEMLKTAVDGALEAKKQWEELPFENRAGIFMKAADLLATKYRAEMAAAVMLGTGKNVWQAEIDVAELIDFWRMNCNFAQDIYKQQPPKNPHGQFNRVEYRPLEGFVVAIAPFNFVAIAGNLPSSPALMGNVCIWKPASTAVLSAWVAFKILRESGLPAGVMQFLPGSGVEMGDYLFQHKDFAGVHFTGSTGVFNGIWQKVATNLNKFRSYPRIVGETGGKNFHLVHPSADVDHFVQSTIRGAYEYQGQKCSATSRIYVPTSLWPAIREGLAREVSQIKVGPPEVFDAFMCGVIDAKSFANIKSYIDDAKASSECEIIAGGNYDDSKGYFVDPTVILTTNAHYKTMEEEIFGPVLTVYVYEDAQFWETLELVDSTSTYALTGSVYSQDTYVSAEATRRLRNAAGNFYVNDKSTGSVVGQQPFGGARGSGTNDKAGSASNLSRWVSLRSIKETYLPTTTWKYPHMASSE